MTQNRDYTADIVRPRAKQHPRVRLSADLLGLRFDTVNTDPNRDANARSTRPPDRRPRIRARNEPGEKDREKSQACAIPTPKWLGGIPYIPSSSCTIRYKKNVHVTVVTWAYPSQTRNLYSDFGRDTLAAPDATCSCTSLSVSHMPWNPYGARWGRLTLATMLRSFASQTLTSEISVLSV